MKQVGAHGLIGLALLLPLMLSSGCSTMSDVVKAKESGQEGTTKIYPVSTTQAWDISKTVFRWEGCGAIEEHKHEGYMLTSSGVNLVPWGTVMGAWIEPAGKGSKVTVVTKRRISLNVATTLTEATYQKRFAQAVDIVKSGKPLPATAPN